VGDVVTAALPDGGDLRLRVVGTVLPPDPQNDSLGGGAVVSPLTLDRLAADVPAQEAAFRFAPGADRAAVVEQIRREHPGALTDESYPARPADVANVAQIGSLPWILGAFLGLLGLLALGHGLVTAVRRRKRDLAVLRTIGFTRRQLATAVLAMATTIVGIGLVVGVPVGLTLARLAWKEEAGNLHVASDLALPALLVAALVPVALLFANFVAWLPARVAARVRPAVILRSE
jgi:predicted lysophospholipase L1 biosynthesis ABC-type transport system permease subunit